MLTIPGSKVHKSNANLLAGGYLNLGPAKNLSKKPYFEKNERITNVFRIAGVQSTQQFGIRVKIPFDPNLMMIPGEKGQKCDASVLAGGFMTLGPAQNMSKKPFFEEK